jgi:hypothetical protein
MMPILPAQGEFSGQQLNFIFLRAMNGIKRFFITNPLLLGNQNRRRFQENVKIHST